MRYQHDTPPATNGRLVDEEQARRLAEKHNLPPIEVDAALYGVDLQRAESVLQWIEQEEGRLTKEHGLLAGRRLYKPVKMLRSWSRKRGAGS